jgi:hypothetical protein
MTEGYRREGSRATPSATIRRNLYGFLNVRPMRAQNFFVGHDSRPTLRLHGYGPQFQSSCSDFRSSSSTLAVAKVSDRSGAGRRHALPLQPTPWPRDSSAASPPHPLAPGGSSRLSGKVCLLFIKLPPPPFCPAVSPWLLLFFAHREVREGCEEVLGHFLQASRGQGSVLDHVFTSW